MTADLVRPQVLSANYTYAGPQVHRSAIYPCPFCIECDASLRSSMQYATAMLNYACEAGKAGNGNRAFTAGAAAKMTTAVR